MKRLRDTASAPCPEESIVNLITWNVQWCRGGDGRVDPQRIARVCRDMADFDVLCLQEVARGFRTGLKGSRGEDQFRLLAAALPGYTLVEGIAVDTFNAAPKGSRKNAGRRQFGNAIFSRLPVLHTFRHLLPWPADTSVDNMQRVAVEIVVRAKKQPLRVTTTHLEYYSATQRRAQVERLRELQAEAAGHAGDVQAAARRKRADRAGGPFEAVTRPASGVLTGDFNFRPSNPSYKRLQAPMRSQAGRGGARRIPAYRDAWAIAHPEAPHQATVGVHDRKQWPGKPFCFDFIFVTEDLGRRVEDVVVNRDTDASDHQPVLLRLAD
jgi:endonuclease/exonuclease/phosphatase family metal-dependent hydrolase